MLRSYPCIAEVSGYPADFHHTEPLPANSWKWASNTTSLSFQTLPYPPNMTFLYPSTLNTCQHIETIMSHIYIYIYIYIYIAVHCFWLVEELAYGPTGCGEVARGGCSFAWNFSVTRSNVLTEVERRTTRNTTLSLH